MSKVVVFYPVGRESQFEDWAAHTERKPAAFQKVFSFDVDDGAFLPADADNPLAACEVAFAVLNSYADEMHCPQQYADDVAAFRALEQRSLSVGDVVFVGEQFYVCALFGFEPVAASDVNVVNL